MIIIGYTNINNISPTINLIIIITKDYLFHFSNINVSPNILLLIERIHQSYSYLIISKKKMDPENYVKYRESLLFTTSL